MNTAVTTYEPPDVKWGPAMAALTPKMRAFVTALLEDGTANATRAAAAAGYSPGNQEALRVTGHRLAHDSRVQAALQEEAGKRLGAGVVAAVNVVLEIAADPTNSANERLKAASMILNRAGLHEKTEHKVVVEQATTTLAEVIADIRAMALVIKADPRVMLEQAGIVIDAEFTVIEKQDWET